LVNGKKIKVSNSDEPRVIAWHKPENVEVTFSEKFEGKSLANFRETEKMKKALGGRMIPVGRLDKDSHGLLLLTNDGELANQLAHPNFQHKKEYFVVVQREATESELRKLGDGSIEINERKVSPCPVEQLKSGVLKIILKEGRNRQIRKMCKAVDLEVRELFRTNFCGIEIGELPEARWRVLSAPEVEKLRMTN